MVTTNEADRFDGRFDSLEAVADAISEELQGAVTIEDANHRLLAYSSHDPQADPARLATIIGRRVPEPVIRSLWQAGVMQRLMASDEPIRVEGIQEVGLGERLAVAIRKSGELLGYVWVAESGKPFGEHGRRRLAQGAQAAKIKLLQAQTSSRGEEMEQREFLWQLLNGYFRSDAAAKERGRSLGLLLPACYRIVVLSFESDITDERYRHIRYMIATTHRPRIVLHAVRQSELVLLAEQESDEQRDDEGSLLFREQMSARFGFAPCLRGRSAVYADYAMTDRSYREALTVLRLKSALPQETRGTDDYDRLGYLRYLPAIAEEKRHRPESTDGLGRLKRYDRENKARLVETLEAYLGANGNPKAASASLHIHANTLQYRLKRIAEIGRIDLHNMDHVVSLYLEIKLDKLTP